MTVGLGQIRTEKDVRHTKDILNTVRFLVIVLLAFTAPMHAKHAYCLGIGNKTPARATACYSCAKIVNLGKIEMEKVINLHFELKDFIKIAKCGISGCEVYRGNPTWCKVRGYESVQLHCPRSCLTCK